MNHSVCHMVDVQRKEEFLGTIKKTSKIAKEYETQYAGNTSNHIIVAS